MLTTTELHALVYIDEGIRWAARTGRIFPRYPGVFAIGRDPLTEKGEWRAAVAAFGDHAVLSHLAAARLWVIWEDAIDKIDISMPTGAGLEAAPPIRLHRAVMLRPEDCTVHRGIPVTTPPRTLISLAGVLSPRQLRSALRRANRELGLDLDSLYC